MMYDGVINKPPLDELYHFNKNHDPNNGQFTSGNGIGYSSSNIQGKKENYKISDIKKGYGSISGEMDRGKKKSRIRVRLNTDSGLNEEDFKKVTEDFKKNEERIEKAVKDSISDSDMYDIWGTAKGMSKNDFLNSLEIKEIYIPGNKWPAEISVWEKDSAPNDLLGYHSLDLEMDLKNPKKTGNISMNG